MEAAVNTVDTLNLAKRFRGVNFTNEQAEALAETQRELEQSQLSKLVTSQELKNAVSVLKEDSANQKASLIIWFTGILFAQGAFVIAVIKLL